MNEKIDEAIKLLKDAEVWMGLQVVIPHLKEDIEKALALLEACQTGIAAKAEQPEPISLKVGERPDRPVTMPEYIAALERNKKAQAEEIDRLTADLKKHGGHTYDCEFHLSEGEDECTCGWRIIEKDLNEKKEGE